MRPTKTQYYINMAKTAAQRGTCLRTNYGAVIVKDDRICSTGYTGSPRGVANCIDTGICSRESVKSLNPDVKAYEHCVSVHAEMNAIISACPTDLDGATMYISGIENRPGKTLDCVPCMFCRRLIVNARISLVIVEDDGDIIQSRPHRWQKYGTSIYTDMKMQHGIWRILDDQVYST